MKTTRSGFLTYITGAVAALFAPKVLTASAQNKPEIFKGYEIRWYEWDAPDNSCVEGMCIAWPKKTKTGKIATKIPFNFYKGIGSNLEKYKLNCLLSVKCMIGVACGDPVPLGRGSTGKDFDDSKSIQQLKLNQLEYSKWFSSSDPEETL